MAGKRKPIVIGTNTFKYKKDAIAHYRKILNSYNFGESLNQEDFDDLISLIDYYFMNRISEYNDWEDEEDEDESNYEDENGDDSDIYIDDIKVAKVQFSTKCFEVYYTNGISFYISYLQMINNKTYTSAERFNYACRSSIQADIRSVKQEYFDKHSVKGHVKCQETNILSKWTELVIDHRQPNTFSIIVDRFIEVNNIDIESLEFGTDKDNHIIFKDSNISSSFREYHKEKANLRIVRKECNSSRTGLARLKSTSNDLKIK